MPIRIEKSDITASLTKQKKPFLSPAIDNIVDNLIGEVESFFKPRLDYLAKKIERTGVVLLRILRPEKQKELMLGLLRNYREKISGNFMVIDRWGIRSR